jgi:hypothetical protein
MAIACFDKLSMTIDFYDIQHKKTVTLSLSKWTVFLCPKTVKFCTKAKSANRYFT